MYFGDPCYYLVRYVLCSRCVAVSRWVGHYHTFMIATKWYVVTYVLYLLCSSSFLSWCWLAYQKRKGAKTFLKLYSKNSMLQWLLKVFFSKNFSFLLEINQQSIKPKCDNWLSLDLQDLYIKWFLYAFVLMYVKRVDQSLISCHILI